MIELIYQIKNFGLWKILLLRNSLQSVCKTHMTKDEYLEYMKNAQNSTIKKNPVGK